MVIIIITTKSTTRQPSLSIDVEEENVDIDDLVEDEDEKACSKGGRDIDVRESTKKSDLIGFPPTL